LSFPTQSFYSELHHQEAHLDHGSKTIIRLLFLPQEALELFLPGLCLMVRFISWMVRAQRANLPDGLAE